MDILKIRRITNMESHKKDVLQIIKSLKDVKNKFLSNT